MQNILKTTLNIRLALIETPEVLWNNLAPSASPLLALGSDLSNKGSGAALPSDTKSEQQLLLDCRKQTYSIFHRWMFFLGKVDDMQPLNWDTSIPNFLCLKKTWIWNKMY